ncbi:MAG: hypothetical protein Q4E03_06270 [Trueperella sp.]|nr:hypothetical protein [Trueperella sp.]
MSKNLSAALIFSGSLILGIALFVILIIAMGARPENIDLSAPPATSSEEQRQAAATAAHRINQGAQTAGLTGLASAADAWETKLGGVWIPWPDGAPAGYENPAVSTEPTGTGPEYLISELTDLAKETYDFSPEIAADASVQAVRLGAKCPSYNPADIPATDSIAVLYAAKQWFELGGANLPSEHEQQRQRVNLVAQVISQALANGAADTRKPLAPLPAADPIASAYQIIGAEILHQSETANEAARQATVGWLCELYSYPDAPSLLTPSALPAQ